MICGKGKSGPLRFGDEVSYFIPGPGGGSSGRCFVAGEMAYSTDGEVVLLVTEQYIGMPIAAGHCSTVKPHRTIADIETTVRLRERSMRSGIKLKPLEAE